MRFPKGWLGWGFSLETGCYRLPLAGTAGILDISLDDDLVPGIVRPVGAWRDEDQRQCAGGRVVGGGGDRHEMGSTFRDQGIIAFLSTLETIISWVKLTLSLLYISSRIYINCYRSLGI